MKKSKFLFIMAIVFTLAGCVAKKETDKVENVVGSGNSITVSENEVDENIPESTSKFYIENDEIAIIDYTNLDFIVSSHDEPTDSEMDEYIAYLLESYETETGDELGDSFELTEDVLYWLTGEEGITEEEFHNMVFDTLHDYNINEAFYNDLDTIYGLITESAELRNYTEEELEKAKEMEFVYVESSAKYNGVELDVYKRDVLNITTDEEYESYIEEAALLTIKSDKVIKNIAEKEGLSVNNQQYEEYLENATSYYGYETKEDLLAIYNEEELKTDILYDIVLEYIYNMYVEE